MILSTRCECDDPGYCQRHQMAKGRMLWLACQRDQTLFEFWEQQSRNDTPNPTEFQPLPRCQHRGRDALEMAQCELCGNRHVQVAIYQCGVHGRCTERRFGNGSESSRTTRACLTCPDYLPMSVDSDLK